MPCQEERGHQLFCSEGLVRLKEAISPGLRVHKPVRGRKTNSRFSSTKVRKPAACHQTRNKKHAPPIQSCFEPWPLKAFDTSFLKEHARGSFAAAPTLPAAALQQPPEAVNLLLEPCSHFLFGGRAIKGLRSTTGEQALFEHLDRDRDGVLSREEFLRIQALPQSRLCLPASRRIDACPSNLNCPYGTL